MRRKVKKVKRYDYVQFWRPVENNHGRAFGSLNSLHAHPTWWTVTYIQLWGLTQNDTATFKQCFEDRNLLK